MLKMLYLELEVLSDRDRKFSVPSTQLSLSMSMDNSWIWGSNHFLYPVRLAPEGVGFEVCYQCNRLHPRPDGVELFLGGGRGVLAPGK